jgi:hypothetical protein
MTATSTTQAALDSDQPDRVAASAAWLASTLTGEPVDETVQHAETVADYLRTLVPPLVYPECPVWCAEHWGGEREIVPAADGHPQRTIITARLHERVVFDARVADGDLYRQRVRVRAFLDRCDNVGEPIEPTRLVVEVCSTTPGEMARGALTSAEARKLAAALSEAADLMDANAASEASDVVA